MTDYININKFHFFLLGPAYMHSPATSVASTFPRVASAFQPFFTVQTAPHPGILPASTPQPPQHCQLSEAAEQFSRPLHQSLRDLHRYHKIFAQGPYASIQGLRTSNALMAPYV